MKETLLGPLSDITARNASVCSLYSIASNRVGSWALRNENTPPPASRSLLNLVSENNSSSLALKSNDHGSRKQSGAFNSPPPFLSRVTAPADPYSRKSRETHHVPELSTSSDSSDEPMEVDGHFDEPNLFNLYEAIHVPLPAGRSSDNTADEQRESQDTLSPAELDEPQRFRRWLSTLRRRHVQRRHDRVAGGPRPTFNFDNREKQTSLRNPCEQESLRRHSESMSSSMGCITTMKSASMTAASTSIAPRSDTGLRGKVRIGNRSSHYSDARRSLDSHRGRFGSVIDESAWLRSLQRRKIVEELIASEESYIADLKVLINVRQRSVWVYTMLTMFYRITS
jgi:hypothetical protein